MKYDYGISKTGNDGDASTYVPSAVVGIVEVQSGNTIEIGDSPDRLVPEDQLAPLPAD